MTFSSSSSFFPFFGIAPRKSRLECITQISTAAQKRKGKNADKWQKKSVSGRPRSIFWPNLRRAAFLARRGPFIFFLSFPFCQSILRPPVRNWEKNPARQKREETLTLGRRNYYFFRFKYPFPLKKPASAILGQIKILSDHASKKKRI